MKWSVEIQKTSLDKRNIFDLLSEIGITLIEGVRYLEFTSDQINECLTVDEVFSKAKEIRELFIGAINIDSEFQLGAIVNYSFNPPKFIHCLEPQSIITGEPTIGKPTLSQLPPIGFSEEQKKKVEGGKSRKRLSSKI